MKKIIILFMFTLFIVCVYRKDVNALSGSGTSASPYLVTSGSELKEALSKGTSSWKYIAVTDTAAVTETINVEKGKFRIYAKGANRTVRRSQSMSATVNSSSKPLRCIKIDGSTEIQLGYAATSYKLTINGSKNSFTDNRQCNEWFYIGKNASLTICANCLFTNARNTMKTDEAAPIRDYGTLNIYGEISNCQGNNGGAVKCLGGTVNIYSGSKIHDCKSGTEGGAIYGKSSAYIDMKAGSIYNNVAAEEGGGIFTDRSVANLMGGSIYSNTAGQTGGGVFVGDESTLVFGSKGSGPTVSGNYAEHSGGGIRCNGGTSISGGVATFEGGTITGNSTDVSGGGISIGKPSDGCASKLDIENIKLTNNYAAKYGGGICFSVGGMGLVNSEIKVTNCTITGNRSDSAGGGMHVNTIVKSAGNTIKSNKSDMGGGVYITGDGTYRMPSGIVEGNTANKGSGVNVHGIFELSSAGYVNANNSVYLGSGKHIDITGKLTVSNVLASNIDPEVKTKGTILVDVTYGGGTAESELYYVGSENDEAEGKEVTKKFETIYNHFLRPSNKNTTLNSSRYIIISEKYKVKYNGNSLDSVANLPENGIAFWSEKYKISENIVSRIGFVLNVNKHWNLSADGTGSTMKPGLDTLITSDTTLYAIWDEIMISSLTMTTTTRYYVVGQKIVLDNEELLKKVKVENDLGTDVTYEVKVTKIVSGNGSLVAKGDNLKTEDYIDTSKSEYYRIYLSSSNYSGSVTTTGILSVVIVDDYYDKTDVRFISAEFINTLDPRSKWKKYKASTLSNSLNNEDNYLYIVDLEKEDIDEIKNSIKNNGYRINHSINSSVSEKVIKQ